MPLHKLRSHKKRPGWPARKRRIQSYRNGPADVFHAGLSMDQLVTRHVQRPVPPPVPDEPPMWPRYTV
jgi:hypothetical protein